MDRWTKDGYFDVWFPALAPSMKLIERFKGSDFGDPAIRKRFFDSYEREVLGNATSRRHLLSWRKWLYARLSASDAFVLMSHAAIVRGFLSCYSERPEMTNPRRIVHAHPDGLAPSHRNVQFLRPTARLIATMLLMPNPPYRCTVPLRAAEW